MCAQAWEEDPLDTLKLMAHLRDVRDGKAEQKAFRLCVKWLYERHPLTLIENLQEIVEVYTSTAKSYSLYENVSDSCVALALCVMLAACCMQCAGQPLVQLDLPLHTQFAKQGLHSSCKRHMHLDKSYCPRLANCSM